MKTELFDFELPPDRIATQPASPRDTAKMLVVASGNIQHRTVRDLPDLLRPGDVMVFNDTRVIPARLTGKRGDAKVEVLLHRLVEGNTWRAFAKPEKRLREGDKILFSSELSSIVSKKHEDGEIDIMFEQNNWRQLIDIYGKLPLPNYIKREVEHIDTHNYQTVYAKNDGAVAAPTAGLHFTDELISSLNNRGIKRAFITLHVGAGTFQPVKAVDIAEHKMHKEYFEISAFSADIINKTREAGGRVVAVGTTSMRALESAADEQGHIKPFAGDTGIFITPGYRFKAVDVLMTNFHLPRSTLFILVSAFMGIERMKEAYAQAIASGYRFYSYGDSSLLFR